ncbi:MAG: glycoside hydrolase family 127 protein [Lentisphaeria bacterium]|nr:glycoside hydrolase family 127 protein [Lentisphaeria bacterium]
MRTDFPRVELRGLLGQALRRSCEKRLKTVDYGQLVEPFRLRNEADGGWRCEFWGKVVRSAILTNCCVNDVRLADIIGRTVGAIMETQTADGCISSYPEHLQLSRWDVWGRKYVLLGLLRYYELVDPNEKVKNCCTAMLDHLTAQVRRHKTAVTGCGEHGGLAAASILGAAVGVYRISGERRFLDFAREIVRSGCSKKHDIFEAARSGTPPRDLGNGKAYEMTSCFQGLADLYEFDPRPEYADACIKYFQAVRDREIFITGAGGGRDSHGEYWDDGALKQTAPDYPGSLGETCVTTTWLHYCEKIADLTGEASPLAEAERALYNGILGAMAPDGTRWVHANPTPLTGGGWKETAPDQIETVFGTPFGGHDCCRAQGPEALALASRLAVRASGGSVELNFFEPLTAVIRGNIRIDVAGNYPLEPRAEVRIRSAGPVKLRVRIPGFIEKARLNGKVLSAVPGEYLTVDRLWMPEDVLRLEFDFSLRRAASPDGAGYAAFLRGPLVLAEDSRGDVPDALVRERKADRPLIDYITAGNTMCRNNTLKVWFSPGEIG